MPSYKKILNKLILNNLTISVAESCTGGLLAYSFTKNKNSSKVFKCGYVTYSNESKKRELQIKNTTLNKYGAVSRHIAEEMVNGLYLKNKTDLCVSITGIAGPGGASKNKKIGLIFIGVRYKSKINIIKKNFKGTRIEIQKKCIDFVFNYLDDLI